MKQFSGNSPAWDSQEIWGIDAPLPNFSPSSSFAYNFKYFCSVISDSPMSDRLRYLAGKSFNKIFTTFHAREERRKFNILQTREIIFFQTKCKSSPELSFRQKYICIINIFIVTIITIIIKWRSLPGWLVSVWNSSIWKKTSPTYSW